MPGRLTRPQADSFLKGLHALGKAHGLYPPGHAAVRKAEEALDRALSDVFSTPDPLLIGLADGYLVVGDCAFVEGPPQARELVSRLEARQIEGVIAGPEATAEDWGLFLGWLRSSEGAEWSHRRISLTRLDRSNSQWVKAKRLHTAALRALEEADRDVRQGRIPDPRKAKECVAAFSELLEETPSVLPGLLLIKDYDNYTFYHSVNVSLLSLGIGRQMGLKGDELESVGVGGLFHDIGKTQTPVDVIRKPTRLSSDEMVMVQWHPVHGRDILAKMDGFPELPVRLVFEHHMGFDGGGYPARHGRSPLHPLTPLVTTADIYDAMTTHRPYQAPLPLPAAVKAMQGMKGAHLAPDVLEAFLALMGAAPVGSLLRLKTGEVGIASKIGPSGQVSEVLIIAGKDGRDLPEGERLPRSLEPGDVAGWVGALSRRVDLADAVKPRR